MSWLGCLLTDLKLSILFVENSQILLKISVVPIVLTFIFMVALNLLVNKQTQLIIVTHNCHIDVPPVDCWKTPIGRSFCEAKVARGYQVKFKIETVWVLSGHLLKVWTFWEGHKIWKNLPLKIWCCSVASNSMWKVFSNCVPFSECPNFNNVVCAQPQEMR